MFYSSTDFDFCLIYFASIYLGIWLVLDGQRLKGFALSCFTYTIQSLFTSKFKLFKFIVVYKLISKFLSSNYSKANFFIFHLINLFFHGKKLNLKKKLGEKLKF